MRMKNTTVSKREVQSTIIKGIITAVLLVLGSLPVSAHNNSEQGTFGWHMPPSVTCYDTQTGTGRLVIQPNAAGLGGGPYGAKYHLYTHKNNQWVLVYTSPFYTYQTRVTPNPLVIPATTGHFAVEAEYWWHDGRSWSGSDRTFADQYMQAADYSRSPIGSAPPAPHVSNSCWVN
jgi:hypothetical protein